MAKAAAAVVDRSQCVRVAVNVRPLISSELDIGCTECISVLPGGPQVQIGSRAFTFDHVYSGSSQSSLYSDCVTPLVHDFFNGYNATVLAYGQTGSGKTYTMGTNYRGKNTSRGGIIPEVMQTIFSRVEAAQSTSAILIKVSFIEIFNEEVFNLLDPNPSRLARPKGTWAVLFPPDWFYPTGFTTGGFNEAWRVDFA